MKQIFSNNILLTFFYFLAGLLFFGISVLVYKNLIDFNSYQNNDRSIQNLRRTLNENSAEIKVEMMMVKNKILNSEFSFLELLKISKESIFVFKDGELKYWNNYIYVPELYSIKNTKNEQLLTTSNGKFLVFKHDFSFDNQKYSILSLIRLTYRYPITNLYLFQKANSTIFNNLNVTVNNYKSDNNIFAPDGAFLFSVNFLPNQNTILKSLFFLVVGFIFWIVCFVKCTVAIKHKIGFDFTVIILSIFLFVIAFFLFIVPDQSLKFLITNFKISNELTLVKSREILFLLVLSFEILFLLVYIFIYKRSSEFIRIRLKNTSFPHLTLFTLLIFNCIILIILFQLCKHIYSIEFISIDIREILKPYYYKFFSILFFIISSFNYFTSSHLVSEFIQYEFKKFSKNGVLIVCLCYIFIGLVSYWFNINFAIISFLNSLYLWIIFKLNLVTTLKRIRYITYIYFFAGAIICCLTATLGFYTSDNDNIIKKSQTLSSNILREEKIFDEKLLNDVLVKASKDKFILNTLNNPIFDKKLIAQKILKYYLIDLDDKYDINIYLFDNFGQNIDDNSTKNFNAIFKSINSVDYKTKFRNIYRVKGSNIGYYCPIILRNSNGSKVGSILIELKLRKIIPYSISPVLLIERSNTHKVQNSQLSYALYNKNTMVSSFGNFNYLKEFKNLSEDLRAAVQNGMVSDGKFHILFPFVDDKNIIISTPYNKFISTFSNFSFLFLLLSFMLAGIILINTFYYKFRQISTTFTTKIQLFINFAFFIPLVVVSVAVFYIISFSYRNDLKQNFVNKAEVISNQLMIDITKSQKNSKTDNNIIDVLNETSRYSQTDINLYANSGKLLASTQSKLFDYAIISKFINPLAIIYLVENFETYALIEEKIGTLTFNTVYYKIKSYNTGEMLGIVAIPFFGSDSEIQSKILEALMVIINVFTVIFILFLIASFFASRMLTKPLSMLTNKIKQTSFFTHNIPLEYKANDEIGLLVNEYNRMLLKLDDSKKALSLSEKESAWREMARQVAHEIKNPLTPMKLTLQNLQRMINIKKENIDKVTNQSIEILLEQIENLNDIASSFSIYTQMPILKIEIFNITELLRKSIFLFESKQDVKIEHTVPVENYFVLGDEKLMNRIFINLITNSLEAVVDSPNPQIKLTFSTDNINVLIQFADNGNGIDKENQSKVFLPYFSTKNTGSGIGLAVAKRGIEQMNGTIWFENLPQKGTVFLIKIPLHF